MNVVIPYSGRDVTFYDCDPTDCVQRYLLDGNWYELANLEFIRDLKVAGRYLDVGAYVGTHSLYFGLFCPATEVYAVEPQPDIYRKLITNLLCNGIKNHCAYDFALSNHRGRASIPPYMANRGGSRLQEGNEIEVTTIDDLNLPELAVVKIDVEGHELEVLQGGIETLANGPRHVFVEMWTEESCGAYSLPFTLPAVIRLLADLGFALERTLSGDLYYFRKD